MQILLWSFVERYYSIIISIIEIIIVLLIAIIIDRYVARKTRKIAKILDIPVEIVKSILTIVRFVLLLIVLLVIATIQLVPPEYFVGAGAIIGTAIGFGLSRFLSDYVSGLYVLMSGILRIGDYVRIDNEEGIVVDMTVSHTKIKRSDGSILSIANSTLAGKNVINYRVEEQGKTFYTYPIRITFDSSKSLSSIEKAIRDALEKYREEGIEANYYITSLTRLEIGVEIVFKTEKPEDIFRVKSEVLARITENIS